MGPVIGVPPILRELGPHWERARRPLLTLLAILLAIVFLLWWFTGR